MTTPILQANPGSFNFSPTIIPQSAGDVEEARVRRLMDLAKLRELTLAPGFQQQQLNLTKQSQENEKQYRTGVLSETSAHNVAEEGHWAQLLGLDQQKLKETAREHDSALSELGDYHKGILRNQLTEGFMAHLAPLYAGNPEVIQNVLKNRDLPELSASVQLLNDKHNKTLADTTMSQINLAKQKGLDTSVISENLKTTNPEAYSLIKDKIPLATTAPQPKINVGSLLAKSVKYGTGPGLLLNIGQQISKLKRSDFLLGGTNINDFAKQLVTPE